MICVASSEFCRLVGGASSSLAADAAATLTLAGFVRRLCCVAGSGLPSHFRFKLSCLTCIPAIIRFAVFIRLSFCIVYPLVF